MRAVLVVPHLPPETVARALVESAPPGETIVAVLLPLPTANATAVVFRDLEGHPLAVDLDHVAAHMSTGGHEVGIAHGHSQDEGRRFVHYREGHAVETLDERDELYLPVDEDGFPDMEKTPVRRADGPPAGWGRFRSCHDLGMKRVFSCRFGPVEHCLGEMLAGQEVGALAYALVKDHRRLHPPIHLPWRGNGRPR